MGSVCLPDAETVFRDCSAGMPNRLKRIPDGEPGVRNWFTVFQAPFSRAAQEMMVEFVDNAPLEHAKFTAEQVSGGIEKLKQAAPTTGYDDAAIESYETFKKLREEGVISKATRFMVCLPTTPNVIAPFVQKDFMAGVEPVYEQALFSAIRRIQDSVPHEDLAIQVDLAADTAFWENVEMYRPWFHNDDSEVDK